MGRDNSGAVDQDFSMKRWESSISQLNEMEGRSADPLWDLYLDQDVMQMPKGDINDPKVQEIDEKLLRYLYSIEDNKRP